MVKNWCLLFLTVIILSGCGVYTPAPQILPAHIREIAIRPFLNRTANYGLEDKLTLRVIDEFMRDGRFEIVPEEQSDGVVIGEIKNYILEPISYDDNHLVRQYKLWILVDVYFFDRTQNITLWKETNLEGIQRYFVATYPGGMSEEEARELVWEKLAGDILRRTIEGFGAVQGASERVAPTSGTVISK